MPLTRWIYKHDKIPTIEGHKGELFLLCCIGGHNDWMVSCSCGWKIGVENWMSRHKCIVRLRKHLEWVAPEVAK